LRIMPDSMPAINSAAASRTDLAVAVACSSPRLMATCASARHDRAAVAVLNVRRNLPVRPLPTEASYVGLQLQRPPVREAQLRRWIGRMPVVACGKAKRSYPSILAAFRSNHRSSSLCGMIVFRPRRTTRSSGRISS
jgi:hypothetical protein